MIVALLVVVTGVIFVGAGIALALVVRDTTRKQGNWGINLQSVSGAPLQCPSCATPIPTVRVPKNLRQFLWGGWTCSGCGVELDKWGKPLTR